MTCSAQQPGSCPETGAVPSLAFLSRAGTPDTREPAVRLRRQDLGTVPPLWPLAHGTSLARASPAGRTAAFMDDETAGEDVPVRVVERTGEPGDMVFCHPLMVPCAAPN